MARLPVLVLIALGILFTPPQLPAAAIQDFEAEYARLSAGRTYSADVPRGRVDGTRTNSDGTPHPYVLLIPETYDPSRRYPVRIWLHGGVGRPAYTTPGAWWRNYDRTASEKHITVIPASWNASKWWEASQSENLAGLLAEVKKTYNVDENQVSMLGISDGGSGVYFYAARTTTPFAAFLPFIGHAVVVNNPRMGVDGEVFALNLINKPLYIVNTENDRLYPYRSVVPYIEQWRAAGAQITFRPIDGAGHDLTWMPDEAPRIEAFLAGTVRDTYPDTLVWQTERTDAYNRAHWVEILKLGPATGERDFPVIQGLRNIVASGKIKVVREGNLVIVETEGIQSYRILLSPEEFDFEQIVEIVTNGRSSFRGLVDRDSEVLIRRNAEDDDRTMLFGAEITIQLSRTEAD